ncbi:DUF4275 family protein [Solibacillus isronensis]|uniref:DUF4275 family protein n=1 Tax=Solibacillus isronensis TaxID=412383 RepID=UPI0009A6D4E9|nr:DUF4275 family protein [Solibacillus isronensis]
MDNLIKRLNRKNMKFTENLHWGIYFRKRWENAFAYHLHQEEKERISLIGDRHFRGYLWHLFSYKKISHLSQIEAEEAFNSLKKTECYIFYEHLPRVVYVEHAESLKADHLLEEEDIYIVDKNFTWTYVVTHEESYGPYFTSKVLEEWVKR